MSPPAIQIPSPAAGAPPTPGSKSSDHRAFQVLIATRPGRDPRRETAVLIALAALIHLVIIGSLTLLNVAVPGVTVSPEEEVLLFSFAESEPASAPQQPIVYHREESVTLPPVTPNAPLPSLAPRALPPRFPLQGAPQGPTGLAGAGNTPGAVSGRPLRAAERLRPQLLDPRLWAPPSEILGSREGEEARYRARLYSRIEEFNDSVAADAEAKRKGLDWTIKGENGERWGISPEGIHLGRLTLPAPQMSSGGERGAESRRNAADWKEIEQTADRARVRNTFNDRAKAIRTRKDEERSKKQNEPPPSPPPSTSEPKEKPIT
jgi:hypothetical protein